MQPPALARYSPRFASPWASALPNAAYSASATAAALSSRITHSPKKKRKPRRSGASSENPRSVLLAEILVAVPATCFADLGDGRPHAGFVTGFRSGHKCADRALELFLRFLELGRLAPDRRQ